MKLVMLIPVMILLSCITFAQNDNVIFVKEVPAKLKSDYSYSFFIGYEVLKDSDIALDISGGPYKYWTGKTVAVKKGKGILEFKLSPKNKPKPGKGYKILASIRDRGGDWRTTKASSVLNNIEITKKTPVVKDDIFFTGELPTSIPSSDLYQFDVKYEASEERLILVAIYSGKTWIGASKRIPVNKGSGIKKIPIKLTPPSEGDNYRYILYYGSGEGFPNQNSISKEISGIHITKAEKKLRIRDLRAKSITLSLNKASNILTLPGDITYEHIQIITATGNIIKEGENTNSIVVSDVPKGAYFVVTSKDEYYQFVKL